LKSRDFFICAAAVPVLYVLYLALGLVWAAGTGVFEFLTSIGTNPTSFTVVSYLFTVLSAVCAVTAFREFEDERHYSIESWKEFGSQHAGYLRWYVVALAGAAIAALQLYMLKTMPAAPADFGFRAWMSIVGLLAGGACLASILVAAVMSVWTFWQGRPMKTAQ
jgi:hypothetical protein